MKILCKLTTQDLKTYKGFQWELGKKETITTEGGELCSNQFFHYYEHPLLAVILNPIHADIENPRIFLVETSGETRNDRGLKAGSKELTLVEEIELPEVTLNQKIAFGILCALEVSKEPSFVKWATSWLDGSDRSIDRAARAADYAARAASYAARSAARVADYAARAASYAARSAARVADYAANAAANAADYASYNTNIDLIALAKKALTYN